MGVRLLITGRMYHLATDFPDCLELAEQATLHDALQELSRAAGNTPLPDSCLVAVNGDHVGTLGAHSSRALHHGDEVALIVPVAGG